MFELGVKLLASYLLGSLVGALLVGRIRGRVDIRTMGSGNAGATNALRTQGAVFALAVLVVDLGKGAAAVLAVAPLAFPGETSVTLPWMRCACGLAVVAGHVCPFWFDFRGGKGAATAWAALACIAPLAGVAVAAVWLLVLLATGFVGLSTLLAACAAPLYALLRRPDGLDLPLLCFGGVMALLLLYTHRGNIGRMLHGEESRMEGAMLWRRRLRPPV